MMFGTKKKALLTGGLAGLLAIAAYSAAILWQASRAAKESAREMQAASQIRFTSQRLDHPPQDGFEWFSSPAVFSDAVPFRDRLFVCGPAGLYEFDSEGALKRRFRGTASRASRSPLRKARRASENSRLRERLPTGPHEGPGSRW